MVCPASVVGRLGIGFLSPRTSSYFVQMDMGPKKPNNNGSNGLMTRWLLANDVETGCVRRPSSYTLFPLFLPVSPLAFMPAKRHMGLGL